MKYSILLNGQIEVTPKFISNAAGITLPRVYQLIGKKRDKVTNPICHTFNNVPFGRRDAQKRGYEVNCTIKFFPNKK